MKELKLYEKLKEAYGSSSRMYNNFKELINKIKWDNTFIADNEHYFIKGDLTLTIENIDPFKEKWAPSVWIGVDYFSFE